MSEINLYSTTTLGKVLDLKKPPILFLWRMLIGAEPTHTTESIEVHSRIGDRTIVPFVGRYEDGTFIRQNGFEAKTYTPQLLKPYTVCQGENLLKQRFGTTKYASALESAKKVVGEELKKLRTIIARTKQYHLAQLLTTGILPSNEEDRGIDFGDFEKVILSGASLWTDPNSDPIQFLKEQREKIQEKTGRVPDVLILSPRVGSALQNHPKIIEKLKAYSADFAEMKNRELETGVAYLGRILEINTAIYTFVDFVDKNGVVEKLLPEKGGLYVSEKSFRCEYAAIVARENPQASLEVHVKQEVAIKVPQKNADLLELQSAPFVRPEVPGSWVYFEAI